MAFEKRKPLIGVSLLFALLVVLFITLGFSTDHWMEASVDRMGLSALGDPDQGLEISKQNTDLARIYFDRNKGVLRECYPGRTIMPWASAQNGADEVCFHVDFKEPPSGSSNNMRQLIRMKQATLTIMVLAVLVAVFTVITGFILIFFRSIKVAHVAAGSSFLVVLFALTTVILFHAVEYSSANNEGGAGEHEFQMTWSQTLIDATNLSYGYSYPCTWVGIILAGLDGVLYLLVARAIFLKSEKDSESASTSTEPEIVYKQHRRGSDPDVDRYGYARYPDSPSMVMRSMDPSDSIPVYHKSHAFKLPAINYTYAR